MVERGGLKVGLVGLALLGTPITTMPSNVATLRFHPGGPIVAERAKALRARGADLVIVVAHASFDCDSSCRGELADVAIQAGGDVDAIIGGHSHNEVPAMVGGVPLMRARSSGRAVAVVDLPVARAARAAVRPRVVYVATDSVAPDTAIERIVANAVAPVREVAARPIATSAEELRRRGSQYPLGNLIADAQRAAGGTDVAVMNNGGIRATLPAGPITFGQVYEVQPFGNMLMRLTATGTALKAYLERLVRGAQPNAHVSGVLVRFDPSRPPGDRIVSVTVGGAPLDLARTYTVTMSDFMATGGDGLALAAPRAPVETGIADIDAFITFVRALPGGVVRADPTVRLQAVP
jgi:5'-nucleotidase